MPSLNVGLYGNFFIVFQRSASRLPGSPILNVAQCKLGTDDISWLLCFTSPCLVYTVYIFMMRFSLCRRYRFFLQGSVGTKILVERRKKRKSRRRRRRKQFFSCKFRLSQLPFSLCDRCAVMPAEVEYFG